MFIRQPAIPNTVALTNKYVLHACFYRRLTANMGGIIDKPNVRQFPLHYAVFVVPDAKRRGPLLGINSGGHPVPFDPKRVHASLRLPDLPACLFADLPDSRLIVMDLTLQGLECHSRFIRLAAVIIRK